jgi:hypothetical protein
MPTTKKTNPKIKHARKRWPNASAAWAFELEQTLGGLDPLYLAPQASGISRKSGNP